MKKIYLSDSGPKVSKAIYSLWRWEEMESLEEEAAKKVFTFCLELGINTFEFSASAKNDKINKVFFDCIAENNVDRKDLVILVRLGKEITDDGITIIDHSRNALVGQLETFLQRSGRQYVDMLLLDELDHLTNIETIANTLGYLVHSGVVKHIGVANFTSSQYRLLKSVLQLPIVTNHMEFSLLKPGAIFDGRLDEIKESFGKALVWAPLAGGDILDGISSDSVVLRETLSQISKELNIHTEQVAVAWLLNLGMLPVIGSPDINRIKNVAEATSVTLTHQQWYKLFNLVSKMKK